jgi:hypothetical protein
MTYPWIVSATGVVKIIKSCPGATMGSIGVWRVTPLVPRVYAQAVTREFDPRQVECGRIEFLSPRARPRRASSVFGPE